MKIMRHARIVCSAFAVICGFFLSHQTFAFSVITDKATFLLNYNLPSEIIKFDTAFPTSVSHPLPGGRTAYEEGEDAWSPSVSIGTLVYGSCCWAATTWYGNYISPSIYNGTQKGINSIYIALNGPATVLSLNTSNGFYGLVPNNSTDRFFSLPRDVTLSEVALGFTKISPVAEPESSAMLLVGLGLLGLIARREKPARGKG